MIFTNAYFLVGLIFSIIPFILHLLAKKRIVLLKFPSLIFIKKSLQKESKRIRIKEILLLIIRTLIIIFLVLSIAKPVRYIKGADKILANSSERKSIVIIMDNSYSMGVIFKGESLFNKSKRISIEIIHKLIGDNDNLSLILTADPNRIKFFDLTFNKSDVIHYIKGSKISLIKGEFFKSLQEAEKILDKSNNPRRLIYLITDMQKNIFIRNDEYIYKYIKIKYPVFIIINNSKKFKNSAIIKHQVPVKLNFIGDTIKFHPVIKNYSPFQNNLIIKSIVNNEAVNQTSLSLKKGQKQFINIQYVISSPGYLGGYSEITDGDDLMADNKNYFVVYVPDKIKIGILDNNNEMFYILNAINPAYVLNKDIKSYININEYKSIPLSTEDQLFILNYSYLKKSDINRLKNILLKAGLLIFPSHHMDVNNFNSILTKNRLIEGLVQKKNINRKKPFRLEFIDYSHPIFNLFKDIKIFKNVKVYSYYKIKLENISYNTRVIAKFMNNDPAIVEYNYIGQDETSIGKIILFTFLPDIEDTDIVYNPNFPPLIHQTVKYLIFYSEEDIFGKFFVGQSVEDIFSILGVKSRSIKCI